MCPYYSGATAHSNAYFGEGQGKIHLDSVKCSGSEYIVTDCEIDNSGTSSSHSLDVGVKCQPGVSAVYIAHCTKNNFPFSQLMRHIEREIFVWWEEPTIGRVEWRYTGGEVGGQSVTLRGVQKMLLSYADSYDIIQEVVCKCIF